MMRKTLFMLVAWLAIAAAADAARVVAIGDIHGEIDGLTAILGATGLSDGDGRWTGGDAILVQTGDTTDRGAAVRAVLDRLRGLEAQAPASGGRVVALLGNHEISNLVHLFDEQSTPAEVYHRIWSAFADERSERRQKDAFKRWRRWQRRYPRCGEDDRKAWLAAHPPGFVEYIEALSADGEYGRWLRGLPVVAEVDGSIFLHGGLSPAMLERGYESLARINDDARAVLRQLDRDRARLLADGLIVSFSTLQEMHCALAWEIAIQEATATAESIARAQELTRLRNRLPGTPTWLLTDPEGPVWFRGLAQWDPAEKQIEVDRLLAAYGGQRFVVGHTPGPGKIRSRFDGKVFLIDTAMAYAELGGSAAALELDGERISAVYPDRREQLVPAPPAPEAQGAIGHGALDWLTGGPQAAGEAPVTAAGEAPAESWVGPDGAPLPFTDVAEVLDFLANAKVVESKVIETGITRPSKLLLERDGVRAHAVFHDVAIQTQRERLNDGKVHLFFRDHYANNVAAFELARLLGMRNVPPATIRRFRGAQGSVQLWIEGGMTEAHRRREKLSPQGGYQLTAYDMWVFDNLINNIDRNQGNILYDGAWNVWFIDHTRSMSRVRELPSPERVKRCSRRLWQALHELDETRLKARLKPHVGVYEIRALLVRRDKLVELLEKKIAEEGEDAVLFSYGDRTVEPPAVDEIPAEPAEGGSYQRG